MPCEIAYLWLEHSVLYSSCLMWRVAPDFPNQRQCTDTIHVIDCMIMSTLSIKNDIVQIPVKFTKYWN